MSYEDEKPCRCGLCPTCEHAIALSEPEPVPTCGCGAELLAASERAWGKCWGCAQDTADERIAWMEAAEAAE